MGVAEGSSGPSQQEGRGPPVPPWGSFLGVRSSALGTEGPSLGALPLMLGVISQSPPPQPLPNTPNLPQPVLAGAGRCWGNKGGWTGKALAGDRPAPRSPILHACFVLLMRPGPLQGLGLRMCPFYRRERRGRNTALGKEREGELLPNKSLHPFPKGQRQELH